MDVGEDRTEHRVLIRALLGTVAIVLCTLVAAPPDARAQAEQTRYSIVGGCYALRADSLGQFVAKDAGGYAASASAVGEAEPFRLQATDLGRYLFYGTGRDFLAVGANAVVADAEPSDASDLTVRESGAGFTIVNGFSDQGLAVGDGGTLVPGEAETFRLVEAQGCPEYPEVELNVEGTPGKGSPLYGEVTGTVEGHMHGMAFEFLGGRAHCGRPWHRFGAPYALVDCPDHAAGDGCGAVLDNVLYGEPARCHSPMGWPTFEGWPDHQSLTHEQSYWRWLERAWAGGLRVYVNLMVENRALCELYPLKQNSCDEMESVLLQIERIREFEDYIDAQSGGPGKGFFRIVESPAQARKVINQGKLAVVLGMEVSEPFGCSVYLGAPRCDEADIDSWLDRLHKLGVRQLEITNKFDNALTGVKGDGGSTGTIVNGGNFYTTGRFWDMESCDDPENHDNTPTGAPEPHNEDLIIANGFAAFTPPGAVPAYSDPPNCNTLGLTPLGEHAVRTIIDKQMIFDPDHMSLLGRNQALNLVESKDYSGIFSSHSWSTPNALPRIYKLGGVITPSASGADGFVEDWQDLRDVFTGRQYFGIGYGADQNGFASQPGPRDPAAGPPVTYPFRSLDGSTKVMPQTSGTRVYDINVDGIAHYGLYADWYEDVRLVGGRKVARDLARGAEAYLQMWERAEGIGEVRCDTWRQRFLTKRGLGRQLRLGYSPKRVLKRAGQPSDRERTWRWCARTRPKGAAGAKAKQAKKVVAAFTERGKVGLVGSTLRKHRADGIRVGMGEEELRKSTGIGGGLRVTDAAGGRQFVYGIRRGRISFVAVVSSAIASSAATVRAYVRRAGLEG